MPRGKSVFSISDLERMLNDRRSTISKLQKQRATVQQRLNEIDREISKMGGAGAGPSRSNGSVTAGGRTRNHMSLGDAIAAALDGKEPMAVGDIVSAVEKSGYRSSSANFRGIVNQTLIKDKRFNAASRGLYQAKK